jgi:hypothetical protein
MRAKEPSVVRVTFDAAPPQGARRVLRLADNSHERRFALKGPKRVSVVVAVPRGESLVLVKTDPAPTSLEDAIVLSHLQVRRARQSARLHAISEAADPGF